MLRLYLREIERRVRKLMLRLGLRKSVPLLNMWLSEFVIFLQAHNQVSRCSVRTRSETVMFSTLDARKGSLNSHI